MTNDAVAKMTADYIWKNRDSGWVKNAALVQEAIPQICRLLARAVRDELASLEDYEVAVALDEEDQDHFEVTISNENWESRQLVFGCDSEWSVGDTWFGVYDAVGSTDKETRKRLQLALDSARSDRSNRVRYDKGYYPAFFYTQSFFDAPDMVKAIAEEAKRLTCKLDKALRDLRPKGQADES